MADSILSSFSSRASLNITNSADDKDLADGLKVLGVSFRFRARAMRHIREDGTSIVDAKVIEPARVEIDAICPTLDVIEQVNNCLMDRAATYTVTSKGIRLQDVVASEFQIKQSPEMISASPIKLSFNQLQRQGGVNANKVVEQAPDSSAFNRGIQSVRKVTTSIQDSFAKMLGAVGG